MVNISAKQRRIANAKAKGLSNKQIAQKEYPNANPESQAVIVSRELKKPNVAQYVEQMKEIAIKNSNITWQRITDNISNKMDSQNENISLSATKLAATLLMEKPQNNNEVKDKLLAVASDANELQIIRAYKSKDN